VFTCYVIEAIRCFISISKRITSSQLTKFQMFHIFYTIAACVTVSVYGEFAVASAYISSPIAVFDITIVAICLCYLCLLVLKYMKDSKLSPTAIMLVKTKVSNITAHISIFLLCCATIAVSIIWFCVAVSCPKDSLFLMVSVTFFSIGIGLVSTSYLVGYAVEITQFSIKSRRKLLT
jgi:hypothetical protein